MTRGEALQILETGDFDAFLGVREDVEIEFKGQPYQVDQEGAKFELAKDVAALANGSGGVIIIGVETETTEASPLDTAARIRPMARGLVDEVRYVDIIGARLYPHIHNLRVEFRPTADDPGRGVVLIDVPPQPETDKLFLIQKPVSEGTTAPGWLVGISVRSVGRVDERRIAEIHELISRGLTVSPRLSEMADELAELRQHIVGAGPQPPAPETPADRLPHLIAERIAEFEAAQAEGG
jgi:hypothetical protein